MAGPTSIDEEMKNAAEQEELRRRNLETLNQQLRMDRQGQIDQLNRMAGSDEGDFLASGGADGSDEEKQRRSHTDKVSEKYDKYSKMRDFQKQQNLERQATRRAQQQAAGKAEQQAARMAGQAAARTAATTTASSGATAAAGTAAAGATAAGTGAATAGTTAAVAAGGISLGTILLFIVLALAIVGLFIILISGLCQYKAVRAVAWFTGMSEVCNALNPSSAAIPERDVISGRLPSELGLVNITGVPVDPSLVDQRRQLRQCMLNKIRQLYELSRSQVPPIEWVITSAYRPESIGSYHQTGEAVDIALRNPIVGFGSTDPRIPQLVALAESIGFVEPNGNVVDEYHIIMEGTTGGHIHLEFNYNTAAGQSYCDVTP
jgi:hypothetical protein